MEHVNANQVSHTLVAGDKSMLDTVIHEITHSWFGNDVGCRNWDNFWINEGINVFMERKVLQDFYGLEFVKMDYYTGNTSMVGQMVDWYGLDDKYSSLFPDVGDDDPENSFSDVPYEKGSQFMYYIESLIGEADMQAYLQEYIRNFHGMAITETDKRDFYETWLQQNFPDTADDLILSTQWDEWVFEPGVAPTLTSETFYVPAIEAGEKLARAYVALGGISSPGDITEEEEEEEEEEENAGEDFGSIRYSDYFTFFKAQKEAFVNELKVLEGVDPLLMEYIDGDLNITLGEINPSAKNLWYELGIKVGYAAVLQPAYEWVGAQGRVLYVRPIFRALVDDARDCQTARAWFADYGDSYNTYVSVRVERIIEEGCTEENSRATSIALPAVTTMVFMALVWWDNLTQGV